MVIKIKKYIKISLIILIITIILLSIFKVNAQTLSFPLIGKIIYLDAGHGGIDNGTTYKDYKEKEINLAIVLKLQKELEENGATVYLTRKDDNDLSNNGAKYRKKSDFDNRIKLINNSQADMYISIHQNHYENNKYSGPQVFYVADNKTIAETIQNTLNQATNTQRQPKTINNTYMYKRLNKPGILIECGFLSNTMEREKLITEEYQTFISKVITEGIIKYYNEN